MSESMKRFVFINQSKPTIQQMKSGDVMNLQVGDKVKVKESLQCQSYYNYGTDIRDTATSEMRHLKGKVVTISGVQPNGKYYIKEDPMQFNWTDGMFEYVQEEL